MWTGSKECKDVREEREGKPMKPVAYQLRVDEA